MTEIDRQIALRLKRTKPDFVDKLRKLNEQLENGDCPYCKSGETHYENRKRGEYDTRTY